MPELNEKFLSQIKGKEGCRKAAWRKLEEIRMRDPFIYTDRERGCYFLYGTDMGLVDGAADIEPCFLCYVSRDLENFFGPYAAFEPEKGFWGVKNYWAPEVYRYRERYYMFASFKGGIGEDRGTGVLIADAPEGPFRDHSRGHVTLPGHECLDGTLYVDGAGKPWIVFCHEWTELYYGKIKALPLKEDLSAVEDYDRAITIVDTEKDSLPWIRHMEDSRVEKKGFLTDAPFLYKLQSGGLLMMWSSYSVPEYEPGGSGGYVIAGVLSRSGSLEGPWEHLPGLLLDKNAGHSALFRDQEGNLKIVSHCDDTLHGEERPVILDVTEEKEWLSICWR